jgi:hypothetical protein
MGYYKSTNICVTCSNPTCSIGQYQTLCMSTNDSTCVSCTNKPTNANYDIPTTSACTWTCNSGYYKTGSTCLPCSNPTCSIGEFPTLCTSTSNSVCVPCTKKPLNGSVYISNSAQGSDNCNWQCTPGYYGGMQNTCTICSPGTYSNLASASSCLACSTGSYNNASGMTSCYQCVAPIERGKYLSGCSGTSPGIVIPCTN